jgi:hypothetical protein
MKRIAPLLFLVLASCGGGDAATTTTSAGPTTTAAATTSTTAAAVTTTTAAPGTTAPGDATLGLFSVMFSGVTVVVFNGTAADADLTGYGLCQGGTCAGIPAITLPAGQYLSINVGSDFFFPIPGSLSINEALDIGALDAAGGEVALLDAGALVVSYVAWGSAPPEGYFELAVAAGVWASEWLVETTPATTAITYFPDVSTSDGTGWSSF